MNVALGVVSKKSREITDLSQFKDDDYMIIISGTTAEPYMIENYKNIKLRKFDTYANAKNAYENGEGIAWINDNTEVMAYAIENTDSVVGIPSLGSNDTIAPAVTKGNETLLNYINDLMKELGKENFFHKDYEETLIDIYGKEYEETLVVEAKLVCY